MSKGFVYIQVPNERLGPQFKSVPLEYKAQVAGEIVSLEDLWNCWREHGHSGKGGAGSGNPGSGNTVAGGGADKARKAARKT